MMITLTIIFTVLTLLIAYLAGFVGFALMVLDLFICFIVLTSIMIFLKRRLKRRSK